jgi:hypothetical protein
MTDVVPSSTTTFVIKMSEKHKLTSPSAIKVKNCQKTIIAETRLNKPTYERGTNC